jgi:hypothetical protein
MPWPLKRKRKFGVRGEKAPRRSWLPGQKGQGGEGLSKGYGGSAGRGVGASGPQTDPDLARVEEDEREGEEGEAGHSPSLPSRARIARVLR